jgi:hypothetical protein
MAIPLGLILAIAAPLIGQFLGHLFGPRPGQGGGQRGGGRSPDYPIRIPPRPITPEDVAQTLILTRDLFERIRRGEAGAPASDVIKGALREVEKIATEASVIRGLSGGMQSRVVADALAQQLPALLGTQQQLSSEQIRNVLNEAAAWAAMTGRVGGVLTLPMLQFIQSQAFGEGQLLGYYPAPFHYGMFSPADYARFAQGQAMAQNVQNLFQWLLLLWPIIGGKE